MYKIIFYILFAFPFFAQAQQTDLQLIADREFRTGQEFAQYRRAGNDANALAYRKKSAFARYNPVSLMLKGAMLGYQRLVSQQLARSCPYQISCSNFSKQAIEQYGVLKGVFLSADRITRCNRIGLLDIRPIDIDETDGTILDSLSRYR
ncbi:MAG: membrane protein insertion efficiency factor YidD [Cytophagales bacterium]|nr:MAG: membrane protein insertion efficiency factor YidD [Cytophagales bacterium]